MTSNPVTRREASVRLFSIFPLMSVAGVALPTAEGASASNKDISRNCECIHQEVRFSASPSRLYKTLTDARQFGNATESIMPGSAASTVISPHVGGEFCMFKGIILGRHIEMVPNVRLVQAWREKDWEPGIYSVVRFQLNFQSSGTQLVFDHKGFPQGAADHLSVGWKSHYWDSLQKYLAEPQK